MASKQVKITGTKKSMSSSWALEPPAGSQPLRLTTRAQKFCSSKRCRNPGGISMLSGGGVAFAHNAEGAFQYLKRTCNGTTPDDILRKMAEEMVGMIDWVTQLAQGQRHRTDQDRDPRPRHLSVSRHQRHRLDQAQGLSRVLGISLGQRPPRRCAAFQSCLRQCQRAQDRSDAVDTRKGIDHRGGRRSSWACVRNMTGKKFVSKPKKGVILACGGYENDDAMKLQYFEAQPVYPVYLGNTGDGLKMAQKAGAGLWHMWHFHGGYGFKFPELPFAIRHVWAGPRNENRKMIWIAVDKFGKRFMDEYPPAPQDTGTRALEFYDADIQDLPAHTLLPDLRRGRDESSDPLEFPSSTTSVTTPDGARTIVAEIEQRLDQKRQYRSKISLGKLM